ncbi:glycosyltransferase family 39 protein [Streptomyces sp. NBC_00690]|uniref:glycosyltransferase family 39 protein n=1 Tax=Streptomyces sp. NBC_00690 TaxID=2975808 RepID=UPI002E292D75|nr:glycosyltransferase family 39 protein [Streptomyces sp. NBC_00690]
MIDTASTSVPPSHSPHCARTPPQAERCSVPTARTPWRVWLPPAALALLLGTWGLEREQTLWSDEAVTYDMATRSLQEIWRTLATVDAVHGLYYLLMHVVFAVWEPGLVSLRVPSVLATAASAVLVARIGLRLAGPRAGALSGLVLALLPAVQRYAQEGRSYALVSALVTWATLLLLERRWRAYAVVVLVACLVHEFAVLVLLAHGATLWLGRSPNTAQLPREWLRAASAVVAGVLPFALFSMTQSSQVAWIEPPSAPKLTRFAVLVVVGMICAALTGGSRTKPLALPLLVLPPGLLIAVSFVHPLYSERYVLFSTIGLALLLGTVLDRFWSALVAAGSTTAVLLYLTTTGTELRSPESRSDNAMAVAQTVKRLARPGDGVLFLTAQRRVWTLAPGASHALPDLSLDRSPRASHTLYGTEAEPAVVRKRMLSHPGRVLAIGDRAGRQQGGTPSDAVKRDVLNRHYRLVEERMVGTERIEVYARVNHTVAAPPALERPAIAAPAAGEAVDGGDTCVLRPGR